MTVAQEIAQPAHAKFSASGSSRWMACPASIQMEEGHPDTSSPFAEEGTAAHLMAEVSLNTSESAEKTYADRDRFAFDEHDRRLVNKHWSEDMVGYVQEYLDYVRAVPGELFIEQRVDFSHVVPEGFGTADAVVYDADQERLTVCDLKYGTGVRVNAEQNSQLALYAIGAINDFAWLGDIKTVVLVVHQPRLDHVSEWETDPEWLEDLAQQAKTAADQALSTDPVFNPGEACTFCKAKGECRALRDKVAAEAFEVFDADDLKMKPVPTLSAEEIAQILPHTKMIANWLKAVESKAISEIDAGRDVPGYKLVEGRSQRRWADASQAEAALVGELDDDAFDRKLISPASAEKLLGKDHPILAEQVTKPSGKPTLVPESDKRKPLPSSADRDFAEPIED